MNNFERVFNNKEELHPRVNGKFFTIAISIEMEEVAKKYFNIHNIYEFNNKIMNDDNFKNKVINIVNEKWNFEQRKIITSKEATLWFLIDYKKYNKIYTLKYIEQLANLNKSLFFENYTDLLGNKIEFEVYD